MRRNLDIKLIHFTSTKKEYGTSNAIDRVCSIIKSGKIKKSNNTGCVSLSEFPLDNKYIAEYLDYRYKPIGFYFERKYIFDIGGRPVIYQPINELKLLHHSQQWRHVTLDLSATNKIDWSWEKEWRLKGDLAINDSIVGLLFPKNVSDKVSECIQSITESNELRYRELDEEYSQQWAELGYKFGLFEINTNISPKHRV